MAEKGFQSSDYQLQEPFLNADQEEEEEEEARNVCIF